MSVGFGFVIKKIYPFLDLVFIALVFVFVFFVSGNSTSLINIHTHLSPNNNGSKVIEEEPSAKRARVQVPRAKTFDISDTFREGKPQ